ncbi:EamA family transporter [archaeon]|jgi:uncharacterized membrane protein|nr:EamA family transporter [archaeon]MBT6697603.1 EamA family transporter [archaeon]
MNQATLIAVSIVAVGSIVASFGALFLKIGANKTKKLRELIQIHKGGILLAGVSLYVLSTVFYTYALKLADLSLIYPIGSLSYIWAIFLSIKYLNEKITTKRWVGVAIILFGAVLISVAG